MTTLLVVISVAVSIIACEGPMESPQPAAKTTEAFGFDFRIHPTDEVRERLDWTYIWAIRFAAQRWEQIVYSGHEVEGFVDMSKERSFTLEHDGYKVEVQNPKTYLDWTNIEIVVVIDDSIEKDTDDDLFTFAYVTYFVNEDKDQYPIVYLSIPHYVVSGLEDGDYTYDQFYQACVHELGHALGFNTTHFESLGLLRSVSGKWEYKGAKGKEAFRRVTRRTGNIPMRDSGHFDGWHVKWKRYFDVMFQEFALSALPEDKLISEVSVGVMEDLGYWVRYSQADDTLLSWRDDPRNPQNAAKPVAEPRRWRCASPQIGKVVFH